MFGKSLSIVLILSLPPLKLELKRLLVASLPATLILEAEDGPRMGYDFQFKTEIIYGK